MSVPVIVLVHPQMGENIGAAARAVLNCGLVELRLVKPRDGWPSEPAQAMSSGALDKMPPVQVFETTAEAIADCHYVYATTARLRDMEKPVMTAREAATDMHARGEQKTAILFGPERAGLTNDDVALAHAAITIPLNPEFSSLNLAQAVLLCAYEYSVAAESFDDAPKTHTPALQKDFEDMFLRLEQVLDDHHFFRSDEMKPTTSRNLRAMLSRAEMTEQEVRTFHGIITALIDRDTK